MRTCNFSKVMHILKKILEKLPHVRSLANENKVYKKGFPPGHFYSPIVDTNEIEENEASIFNQNEVKDVQLRLDEQFKFVQEISKYYPEIPFTENKQENQYYYFENETFSYSDAIFLFSIIRHFHPKKIIEIGSGFSSAVMFDCNKQFFENKIQIENIEPYPYHLEQSFGLDLSKLNLIQKKVQECSVDLFEKLEENDVLFVDSTHVSKTGSDLNYILFNILPCLKKGVVIHFHDIFKNFEYPKSWVLNKTFHNNGFGWNEIYLIRAFLMNNSDYEILVMNNQMIETHMDWFGANMPLCLKNSGGSLWMRKIH